MSLHPDFKDLISAFADMKVRYLLVGGYAVGFHTEPRFTKDIDLWVANEKENIERAYRALATFGAPESILNDLLSMGEEEILYMGAPPVRVDIFKRIKGIDFEEAYLTRTETEWDGVKVSIIGIDGLIAAKRAIGRPQDLLDIAALEQAKKLGDS